MAYPVGRPAHNRLTEERLRGECESRGHVLLEFKHPFIRVQCYCGNVYKQKIHSYRAAKNSCKRCDSARKSKPRPEHSRFMRENNPFKGKRHKPEVCQQLRELRLKCGSWGYKPVERVKPGILYFVRYLDNHGTHFKIGVTKHTVRGRLGTSLISVLTTWGSDLGRCWQVEQASLKLAKRMGWRYSTDSTTELIRGVDPNRWMNLVNALWWILPWE